MILTAVTFLVILSILVFVHELGHFLVARAIGVAVEEFGFGLPPRIAGKKVGNTIYSINWLPIGGFVKLAGEDEEPSFAKASAGTGEKTRRMKHYFWARSKKERAAILVAGVVMNFLLAVAITTVLLTQGVREPSGHVHIEQVLANSPAVTAGLKENDVVKSITFTMVKDGKKEVSSKELSTPNELIQTTRAHIGEEITLNVVRNGQNLVIPIVPRKDYPKGEGPMGIAISDLELKRYSIVEAPFMGFKINISRAIQMVVSLGTTLARVVTLSPVGADVAGPIGIAQVTGQAVKYGLAAVAEFASILSLNLAVLNILPIPALDGGRLLFVFLEKVLGRKVHPAFEKSTHQIGMIILLGLMVLVTINDILRLARGS